MERFPNSSSSDSKENEIVCYGFALTIVGNRGGKEIADNKGSYEELENKKDQKIKSDTKLLPKRDSVSADVLKIELLPNSQGMSREITTKESQRKLQIMMEVKRLELQKEGLENKVEDLKENVAGSTLEKTKRDFCLLQIKNWERKIGMLEKRICYEKRFTDLPLSRWKNSKTLNTQASKSLYGNNLRSDEVLARKMKKLVLKGDEEEEEKKRGIQSKRSTDLSGEQTSKVTEKEESMQKWQSRWRELVLDEEESDEEIKIFGVVAKKPKHTKLFCPPIPDPMAKKRPRDTTSLKEVEQKDDRNSGTSLRLVPKSKRVLQNRASLYKKQLEFAIKHDLETEDIIDNLNRAASSYQGGLPEEPELTPSVTKQQLHLIGALSEEKYLHDN